MALFAITLNDQTTDFVDGADAYQQEGPMTTFFACRDDRQVVDSWSVRLASYRTADISAIRRSLEAVESSRVEHGDEIAPGADDEALCSGRHRQERLAIAG